MVVSKTLPVSFTFPVWSMSMKSPLCRAMFHHLLGVCETKFLAGIKGFACGCGFIKHIYIGI